MSGPVNPIVREICSLDSDTEAVLQYPRDMTVADVADLQKWVRLILRKIKRQIPASSVPFPQQEKA